MQYLNFDTLKFTQHLQKHDYSSNQAEGLSESFAELYNGMNQRFNTLETGINDLSKHVYHLDHKIDTVEKSLNHKIETVEKSLNHKIETVEKGLNYKIDNMDKKFETKFAQMEAHLIKWMIGSNVGVIGVLGLLFYRLSGH